MSTIPNVRETTIAAFRVGEEVADIAHDKTEKYLQQAAIKAGSSSVLVVRGCDTPPGFECVRRNIGGVCEQITQAEISLALDDVDHHTPAFFLANPRVYDNDMVAVKKLIKNEWYDKPIPPEIPLVLFSGQVVDRKGKVKVGHNIAINGTLCSSRSMVLHAVFGDPPTNQYNMDFSNGDHSDFNMANATWAGLGRLSSNKKPRAIPARRYFSEFGFEECDLTTYEYKPGHKINVALHPTPEQVAALGYMQPIFECASGSIKGTLIPRGEVHCHVRVYMGGGSYTGHEIVLAASMGKHMSVFKSEMHANKHEVCHMQGTPHACDVSLLKLGPKSENPKDIIALREIEAKNERRKLHNCKPFEIMMPDATEWQFFESARAAGQITGLIHSTLCALREQSVENGGAEIQWPFGGIYSAIKVRALLCERERPIPPGMLAWVLSPAIVDRVLAHTASHPCSRESIKKRQLCGVVDESEESGTEDLEL